MKEGWYERDPYQEARDIGYSDETANHIDDTYNRIGLGNDWQLFNNGELETTVTEKRAFKFMLSQIIVAQSYWEAVGTEPTELRSAA